jgi:hypothetical protein
MALPLISPAEEPDFHLLFGNPAPQNNFIDREALLSVFAA